MNSKIKTTDNLKETLQKYQRKQYKHTKKCAAILLPLLFKHNECSIILTKRTNNLKNHSGEISFPGGMQDKNEQLIDTALRETYEEIGINKNNIEIIGTLDDEISYYGHRVTPFVGLIDINNKAINFKINTQEVDKILTININHFFNNKIHWTEDWVRNGIHKTVYFYRFKNDIIWGLTGRIIYKALNLFKL